MSMASKQHRSSSASADEGQPSSQQAPPSLSDLPEAVLNHIAGCASKQQWPRCGHPMLRLSRGCRDAVLHSLTRIGLDISLACDPPCHHDFGPCAPLLHRACTLAAPGLVVTLRMLDHPEAMASVLQAGIDCGGWNKVHKLVVYSDRQTPTAHRIPGAFPALQELSITGMQIEDDRLFTGLSHNSALRSLTLNTCRIYSTAVPTSAAALAQLPNLQAIHFSGFAVPRILAAQLTGLTSLVIEQTHVPMSPDDDVFMIAARNAGLQKLAAGEAMAIYAPEKLQHLLSSCRSLTELDIRGHTLDDHGLAVLLQHGTSITSLVLGNTNLTVSRAKHPASWRRLSLAVAAQRLYCFAYLPLKSVQQLEMNDYLLLGSFKLPVRSVNDPDEVIALLGSAASNLAGCPAWQRSPAYCITLSTDSKGDLSTAYNEVQRAQLFRALAPVGGPSVTSLEMRVKLDLGWGDVQVLADSISSDVKVLTVSHSTLQPGFWAALAQRFTNLKDLLLDDGVKAEAMDVAMYLKSVTTRPFSLSVAPKVLDKPVWKLRERLAAWQLHGIDLALLGYSQEEEVHAEHGVYFESETDSEDEDDEDLGL